MALTQISTQGIKDGTITGSDLATNVDLVDDQKLRFGTGNDLQIYHDGSNSYISDAGTGGLFIQGSGGGAGIILEDPDGNDFIKCIDEGTGGAVELYKSGNKKFETTTTGATITGSLSVDGFNLGDNEIGNFGSGNDLKLYHDGGNGSIQNVTGGLYLRTTDLRITNSAVTESMAKFFENGAVELYHNNSKKFETVTGGVYVYGQLVFGVGTSDDLFGGDNNKIILGSGSDFQLFHDGTNSFITNTTGDFLLRNSAGNEIKIQAVSGEQSIIANANGSVDLYYDGSKKLETTSGGVSITGTHSATKYNSINLSASTSEVRWPQDASASNSRNFNIIGEQGQYGVLDVKYANARDENPNEKSARFVANGAVELYHNNTKTFETTDFGAQAIFSSNSGNAPIFKVLHGNETQGIGFGYDSINSSGTNPNILLHIRSKGSSNIALQSSAGEDMAVFTPNGAAKLYHNNVHTFSTTDYGASVSFNSGGGTTPILNVLHANQTQGVGIGYAGVVSTGSNANVTLNIRSKGTSNVDISASNDESMAKFIPNGAVELYHDNTKRFETTSSGAAVNGAFYIGPPAGNDQDLVINKEGTGTLVRFRTTGTTRGTITSNGSTVAYNTSASDKSMKKNFEDWTEDTLALFKNINPQRFNFLDQEDGTDKEKGFIAQDLVKSFPEAYQKNDDNKYMFNPGGMVVYLMKAIQELEAEVAALKAS